MFNYNISAINIIKSHYVIHCLIHASSEDIETSNIILCHTDVVSFPISTCLLVFFNLLLTYTIYTEKEINHNYTVW